MWRKICERTFVRFAIDSLGNLVYYIHKGFRFVFLQLGGFRMEDYKKLLINMLNQIDNYDFLEFVYTFIKKLKENWGV